METNETTNHVVLEGDRASYIGQVPSPHRLRTFAEVGHRVPLHSTAVGKVLVAHLPDKALADLLERIGLPARTAATITDRDRFRAELADVRRVGYAVDDGEEADGVYCLAVPVKGADGDMACALSVSGPASRVDSLDVLQLSETLRVVARRLTDAL